MAGSEIYVLIPSHSMEDFPSDLAEEAAAGLLTSFTLAWHPALLLRQQRIARWHRADAAPVPMPGHFYLISSPCHDWMQHGWPDQAREAGAVVFEATGDREADVASLLELIASLPPSEEPVSDSAEPPTAFVADPDIAASLTRDFLALGTIVLQLELLSRQMRHFSSLDEIALQQRAVAAAKALAQHDYETCRSKLFSCFENLLETRERFYPTDAYFFDLCLTGETTTVEGLARLVVTAKTSAVRLAPGSDDVCTEEPPTPINWLVSGMFLETCLQDSPELAETLKVALSHEQLSLVGGDYVPLPIDTSPPDAVVMNLERGRQSFEKLLGMSPKVYGRREFGLSAMLPMLLHKFGYIGALHLLLDDGIYPDEEAGRLRWQGSDGSVIEALSRIPLATDSASNFLQLPKRLGESMDYDHVAILSLVHWVDSESVWLDDLRRCATYAPVLAKFTTYERYFRATDGTGTIAQHPASSYFSPALTMSCAYRQPNPITALALVRKDWRRAEEALYCSALADVLTRSIPTTANVIQDERRSLLPRFVSYGSGVVTAEHNEAEEQGALETAARRLARIIGHNAPAGDGFLLINPTSHRRREWWAAPGQTTKQRVEVPGCGFQWVPAKLTSVAASKHLKYVDGVLQNDVFEIVLNPETGGIARVRRHGQRENRLSQQLVQRFPRERTIRMGDDEDAEVVKTFYSEMRCHSTKCVLNDGVTLAVEVRGDVIDQAKGEILFDFVETITIEAGSSLIDLRTELSNVVVPKKDPWNNYIANRFAFMHESVTFTRSVMGTTQPFRQERIEAADFIEILDDQQTTTLLPFGRTFHRKTSGRMLDSLLIVEHETAASFRTTIAIDAPHPAQLAAGKAMPLIAVPTSAPPSAAAPKTLSGWLINIGAPNVQLLSLRAPERSEQEAAQSPGPVDGLVLRLMETEGRPQQFPLRLFRPAIAARKRDFLSRTLARLNIANGDPTVALSPFEVADIEVRFS